MNSSPRIITLEQLLRKKSLEFFAFLSKNNIDVGLVSETMLTTKTNLSNKEYKCYRMDRQNRRGDGVAIVVRRKKYVTQFCLQ